MSGYAVDGGREAGFRKDKEDEMRKTIAAATVVLLAVTLLMTAVSCGAGCGQGIKMYVGFEFSTRPDGLPALEQTYDFNVEEGCLMTGAPGASLLGLENHQCDVAMAFGTDAAISENGWHVYSDDKSFWPPYDLAPNVRGDVLDQYPELEDILNELVATFPGGGQDATAQIISDCQSVWQGLNAEVDIDKLEPDEVAQSYLEDKELLTGEAATTVGTVIIGNKNFTEQYIIGQMMKQLLEDRGFTVNLVSDISTTTLRQGMEAGDIDICAEYTGTGYMTHMGHSYEPTSNSELYQLVKDEDEEQNNIMWLDPIWNNNTYVLVSWPDFTEENDLDTLSDLAALYRERS